MIIDSFSWLPSLTSLLSRVASPWNSNHHLLLLEDQIWTLLNIILKDNFLKNCSILLTCVAWVYIGEGRLRWEHPSLPRLRPPVHIWWYTLGKSTHLPTNRESILIIEILFELTQLSSPGGLLVGKGLTVPPEFRYSVAVQKSLHKWFWKAFSIV